MPRTKQRLKKIINRLKIIYSILSHPAMVKTNLAITLELLGTACVIIGLYMIYPPAAFLGGGIISIILAQGIGKR